MKALAVVLSVSLAACGATINADPFPSQSNPDASVTGAAALDPLGTFTFTAQVASDTIAGSFEINGPAGGYTGRISTPLTGDLPTRSVTVRGQRMTIVAATPDGGAVTLNLLFTGDSFVGSWAGAGGGGAVSGTRARR